MKRRFIPIILSVMAGLGLAVFLGLGAPLATHAQVSVTPAGSQLAPADPPKVTVYLKNYWPEYNLAATDFLAGQFDNPDSAANGLISYTVVTTLNQEALAGSAALVIDESADMSLTDAEAALIHGFVNGGGRVGLFTFPRFYWDHEGSNPAAFQRLADIFGNATVGEPDKTELESGDSSADRPAARTARITFNRPYTLTGKSIGNYDQIPFSPIASAATTPVLVSPALGNAPVAVANEHGMLVTNSIGDAVQTGDADETYSQFVTNAIVWLAEGTPLYYHGSYMPLVYHYDE